MTGRRWIALVVLLAVGVGLLVIPQKPWDAIKQDFEVYHRVWREVNGSVPPPKPLSLGFFFVDENKDRAEEMAMRYIGGYYHTAMKHSNLSSCYK